MIDAIQDAAHSAWESTRWLRLISSMHMTGTYKKFMPSFATIYDQDEVRGGQ
jgi:hypothetical protein